MPTPSETTQPQQWTALSAAPRRSVFGNYAAAAPAAAEESPAAACSLPGAAASTNSPDKLIELALARSFVYRFLAQAYEDPTSEGWAWLNNPETGSSLRAASETCGLPPLTVPAGAAAGLLEFQDAYVATFGHAARGGCPLNEIEYGDIKADPLFQPHRLADLSAFYRAFGLEVTEDAGERQDHLCLELEFMCILAAKEAYSRENNLGPEPLSQCGDAQKKFLREHLGRWAPAFARRLAGATAEPFLRALADWTRVFIESECLRLSVRPGSEDLLLRPVDEAAETMCGSCGLDQLPPGAAPAG